MSFVVNYQSSILYVALLFERGEFSKIEASIDNENVADSILHNFTDSFVPHPWKPSVLCSLESIIYDLLEKWDYQAIAKWLRSLIEPCTELMVI